MVLEDRDAEHAMCVGIWIRAAILQDLAERGRVYQDLPWVLAFVVAVRATPLGSDRKIDHDSFGNEGRYTYVLQRAWISDQAGGVYLTKERVKTTHGFHSMGLTITQHGWGVSSSLGGSPSTNQSPFMS